MENSSIWSGDFKQYPMLKTAISTDVLVIGGGISGILTARMLADSGVSCVLVEADRLCGGITRNTTAKISVHHGLIYSDILKKYGRDYAQMYLSANQIAASHFERLSQRVDCDYEKRDSFIYSKFDPVPLYTELSALSEIGLDAEFAANFGLPFPNVGAVRVRNQAQFAPLKLLAALADGLDIYENTRIIEIDKNTAVSVDGKISAKKIVFAAHFPFINRRGNFFLKMYQSRSYVLAVKGGEQLKGIFMDENRNGLSFRNYKNLLLIGGGAHKTGSPPRLSELKSFVGNTYPAAEIVNMWSAQDCMTLDGIPYVGNYSESTPDWYVITGFNKWGMTNAMAAAEIIRDKILDNENENAPVFEPSRSIFHKQLLINGVNSVKNLVTPTVPRCPHMGCALKKNTEDNTWECPCHGSRFASDGELLDNPANRNLEI